MESALKNQMMNRTRLFLKKYLPRFIVESITRARYVKEVRGHNIPEFTVIRSLIKPGDVVLDLGANFGWYTRFMAMVVKKEGKVFSIEPVPLNYKVLEGIVHDLHLDNVEFLHYAVSDKDGAQTMAVPLTGSGEENLYEAKIIADPSPSNTHTITVETRTLDSLFAEYNRKIEFIKCDVEGHELYCLQGAKRVIEKFHPAWLIEVWGDPDDRSSQGFETFRLFSHYGYEAFVYDGKKLCRRKEGDLATDYFFLQPNHIERLKSIGSPEVVSI